MSAKVVDFSDIGTSVHKPTKLAHIVLYTHDMEKTKQWWLNFLGARVQFEQPGVVAFITYDDEHHRVGFIQRDEKPAPGSTTLCHVAFGMPSLSALLLSYRQRQRLHDIAPVRCINHGATISLYYEDPEGNGLEVFHDVFATPAEADAFLASAAFRANPLGLAFEPDAYIARLEAGEPEVGVVEYGSAEGVVDLKAALRGGR